MGYYDNPQIIQPSRGGELIGSAIADFGKSIAQGITTRAERLRVEEKENKLTTEKLQNRKNETDLAYAEKRSKYLESEVDVHPKVNKKIRDILKQSSKDAADAQIKLISETDEDKREEYLDTVAKHDSLLQNAANSTKIIGGTASTYRLKVKAALIGKPGGYVVNGDSDEDIENNTGFLDVVSGMAAADETRYTEQDVDVELDDSGSGFNITAKGVYNGKPFNRKINTRSYISTEDDLDDGLLSNVETMDTFYGEANLEVADKDNKILEGFLLQTYGTVDIDSEGDDQYQLVNARKLNLPMIEGRIRNKAEIKAIGILAADNSSSLKTLIDFTLEKGNGTYKKEFVPLKTDKERQDYLTNLLAEKSFERLTAQIKRTPNKKGGYDYWNPDETSLKIKEKPEKESNITNKLDKNDNGILDSEENEDYRGEYYDNLRVGVKKKPGEEPGVYNYRSRKYYAQNLNRLAGSQTKFITIDDLYKRFLNQPIKEGATLTFADQIRTGKLTKEQVKKSFNNQYPKADLYYEGKPETYSPITDYNLNKAEGRAKLALDFTAGEGTIKKLQGKVSEAKSMDRITEWTKNNPQKQNETIEQYTARYRKSLK